MPPLGRYRVSSPTLALLEEEGRHVARTVPAGAVIEVDGTFENNKLVEVLMGWEAGDDVRAGFAIK